MTYLTTRRFSLGLAGSALLCSVLLAAAGAKAEYTPHQGGTTYHSTPNATGETHFWNALALDPAVHEDAWARLRDNFKWQNDVDHQRVQEWIDHYRSSPENIVAITERARPWLSWITRRLEERDMPGEIALVPFVESSYDPTARNPGGATGLWQFMPGTSDALGIPRNGSYDGRLDVVASTEAALDYLQQQAERWYDGDIELSLAAYNAGSGTVNQARQAAINRGEGDSYWDLQLPDETMNYVPKLLALAAIIEDPERYDVALPEIDDSQAFAEIELDSPISLSRAAKLADTSPRILRKLNPALLDGRISPNSMTGLLVPANKRDALLASIQNMDTSSTSTPGWGNYQVQRGDNLSTLANRYGTSVDALRSRNALDDDTLQVGQTLQVPTQGTTLAKVSRR
ncbi:transglycosylase SLT domain-containing protein [Aidingimonas lacisalsi]|uniref:transglycosylase SLT domain-containing protein n=1 Tax=Aidingimonas lacisalsi TaxID=2604086 RepID=UPI0011D2C14D|nr:transglycosylase SLT domain-containing protein [Aidingimonas lacisalsi]